MAAQCMDWSTRRTSRYPPWRQEVPGVAAGCPGRGGRMSRAWRRDRPARALRLTSDARAGSAITRRLRARHGQPQLGRRAPGAAALGRAAPPGRPDRGGRLTPRATTPSPWPAVMPRRSSWLSTENVGFGRANNRGLAEVSEPVAVLVNPDVELLDDSRAGAGGRRRAARSRPAARAAACSPPTARARTPCTRCRPRRPTWCGRSSRPRWCPAAPVRGWRRGGVPTPRRVGWAVGCAIAARTDTLRRLGPFDEAIFLYGEDMELGLRAAAAGRPDVVLARGPGLPPPGPLARCSPSAASPSSGWRRRATTWWAGAWAGGGRRSTTRSRHSPSPPGSEPRRCWDVPRHASGPSCVPCAPCAPLVEAAPGHEHETRGTHSRPSWRWRRSPWAWS